jgi:hypothetical protein
MKWLIGLGLALCSRASRLSYGGSSRGPAANSGLPDVDPRANRSRELYLEACGSTPVSLGPLAGRNTRPSRCV